MDEERDSVASFHVVDGVTEISSRSTWEEGSCCGGPVSFLGQIPTQDRIVCRTLKPPSCQRVGWRCGAACATSDIFIYCFHYSFAKPVRNTLCRAERLHPEISERGRRQNKTSPIDPSQRSFNGLWISLSLGKSCIQYITIASPIQDRIVVFLILSILPTFVEYLVV